MDNRQMLHRTDDKLKGKAMVHHRLLSLNQQLPGKKKIKTIAFVNKFVGKSIYVQVIVD
jgi:hypothetical protein